MMKRIQKILQHTDFLQHLKKNKLYEKNRKYCKHNLEHCLDVARIAQILNLEEKVGVEKEALYAAALLHDIGRWRQYEDGTPHNEAGAVLAKPVLLDSGFSDAETTAICEAIFAHRDSETKARKDLAGLLCRADKLSRNCMFCKASKQCDWTHKNEGLTL